jgi:hypothetical protein
MSSFWRVLTHKIIDYYPKNIPLLAFLSDQYSNIGKSKVNVSLVLTTILKIITFRQFPSLSKKILRKISVNLSKIKLLYSSAATYPPSK